MATFLFSFLLLILIFIGMALGVLFMGRRIKGSCGGLNAIGDGNECVVCHKEIDRASPIFARINCPLGKKIPNN